MVRTMGFACLLAVLATGCGGGDSSDDSQEGSSSSASSASSTSSAASSASSSQASTSTVFSVTAYGAACDGVTNDTAAIQSALDAASAASGTVTFPQGTCMTGALYVGSNTTVQIDEGVTLQAIQAQTWWNIGTTIASGATTGLYTDGTSLYPQVATRVQGVEMNWTSAILNVRYADNVTISGGGTIDGNGQLWWTHYYGEGTSLHSSLGVGTFLNWDEQRPRVLELYESTNVTVSGVTLENSPFWTFHICYSDSVTVDGVTVYNMPTAATGKMPSTDGIDIDSSTNVEVMNSDITANDDTFVIKSGRDGDGLRVNHASAHIKIHDSTVRAGAAAFTIGSETSGGASDIEVYNIHVEPSVGLIDSNIGYKTGGPAVYSAFIFKSSAYRGGTMENVNIHDIVIDDAYYFMQCSESWTSGGSIPDTFGASDSTTATYLEPDYWAPILVMPDTAEAGYPTFRNFTFSNITMAKVETKVFGVAGITISGETEKGRYTGFSFDNVSITAVNSSGASVSAGSIANAGSWTFTNSSIVDATGASLSPTLDADTTTAMTGLW